MGPSSQELAASFRAAKGLITLASCSERETSSEWEVKGHGLYTYFLAEGLAGSADGNKDGLVDSDELYAYTLDQVKLVGQRDLKQTPVRIIGEDVVGRFLLARIAPSDKRTRSVTNSLGMKFLLIKDGEFLMGSPDTDKDAFDNEVGRKKFFDRLMNAATFIKRKWPEIPVFPLSDHQIRS